MKMIYAKVLAMIFTIVAFIGSNVSSAFAEVNWETNVIEVTGVGAYAPQARNAFQARALAKRAAIADAYRQLLEAVQGVNVTAETTVRDMITESDVIKTHVEGCVRGAQIVSEREISGGGYEVTMKMPLFGGNNSIARGVMPEPPQIREHFPEPRNTISVRGGYTGLIVDCRGLGLKPVMSPVIKNDRGQSIYGYKNLDYDMVIAKGMASYSYNLNSGVDRAGSNPLIVKAVAVENHNGYPVVSVEDSNKILSENNSTHFLEATNVVFIR
ncbi:MAG: LPP20 family lipoprotein [Selenomonadaceae bacterium]|nr:LPP20 family lipoprotein [Selenomonadaceae bacterium]